MFAASLTGLDAVKCTVDFGILRTVRDNVKLVLKRRMLYPYGV